MREQLLPQAYETCERLIDQRITPGKSVKEQADGLQTVVSAMWPVFSVLFGTAATTAIFRRALWLASQDYPSLETIRFVDEELDLDRYVNARAKVSLSTTREELSAIVFHVSMVLQRLIGGMLQPLLDDVEATLDRPAPPTSNGEDSR
jgi:hypothetical protein